MRHLPRTGGPDAAHVSGEHPADELVRQLSPAPRPVHPPEGPGVQHGLRAPVGRPGPRQAAGAGIQDRGRDAAHQLLDVPQVSMEFSAIRSRMAGSEGRLFWRSLGELADTPQFREYLHREFPEQASQFNDPKGRRDFLKLMSASLALAGVSGCVKQPPEQIVPYVRQPEDMVPGRPLFFATAVPFGGVATPVLVESHEGHPTKVEPNPQHPASLGGSDIFAQASILTLYDPDRLQSVLYRAAPRSWSDFVSAIKTQMGAQKGKQGAGLRFLTERLTSPTAAEQITLIQQAFPQAK